jgi:hypothetical protein
MMPSAVRVSHDEEQPRTVEASSRAAHQPIPNFGPKRKRPRTKTIATALYPAHGEVRDKALACGILRLVVKPMLTGEHNLDQQAAAWRPRAHAASVPI